MEDSRWAKRAWDDPLAQSRYAPPPGSPEDVKTREALDSVREHREDVAYSRTAPDPRMARDAGLVNQGSRRAPGVLDLMHAVRRPMTSNDFSGTPGGFIGSLRNVITPFG